MQDVIIDNMNPTPSSNRKKVKNKKKRSVTAYLFDWFIKGMIVALLFAIDFVLYSSSGSFAAFSPAGMFSPEMLYILLLILAFSITVMLLLSFSPFFQNVAAAYLVGTFVMMFMAHYAAFDENSILSNFGKNILGPAVGIWLFNNSSFLIACIVGFIMFLFFANSQKQTIFYFMASLIVILVGILGIEFIQRNDKKEFLITHEDKVIDNTKDSKNFVHIAFSGLASYQFMEDMITSSKSGSLTNKKLQKAADIMLGFYLKNDFTLYPNTYVKDYNPYINMIDTLNLKTEKNINFYILKSLMISKYWNFSNLRGENLYLRENHLFDTFKKAGYYISAYEGSGLDFCHSNNVMVANKCIEKQILPLNVDNEKHKFSTKDKTILLLVQWLENSNIFNNTKSIYTLLKPFMDVEMMPMIGTSFRNVYTVDALDTLDKLVDDVVNSKGNQAFMAYIDFPGNLFMYDEMCRLKPMKDWQAKDNLPWVVAPNLSLKRKAYAEQVSCLYGKLEAFMDKLKEAGKLDNTVIVLHGSNGMSSLFDKTDKNFINEFKAGKLVSMAIRDPLIKKAAVKNDFCSVGNVLKQYLFKKSQCNMQNLSMHDGAKRDLKNALQANSIKKETALKALDVFNLWYKQWVDMNIKKIVYTPVVGKQPLATDPENTAVEEVNQAQSLADVETPEPEIDSQDIDEEPIEEDELRINDVVEEVVIEKAPEVKAEEVSNQEADMVPLSKSSPQEAVENEADVKQQATPAVKEEISKEKKTVEKATSKTTKKEKAKTSKTETGKK